MKRTLRWALAPAVVFAAVSCAPQSSGTSTAGTPAAPARPAPAAPAAPAAPSGGAPAAAAPAAAAPAAAAPAAGGNRSVYSGVYTAAQADRGEGFSRRECASCHANADWTQGRVFSAWQGRPAGEFVKHVQSIMPMDSPGRLPYEQYTDIVAFMFELNNYPAGTTEFPADEAAQNRITIEYRR
jgi:S-disulfanyl-L-cysteine oxidoreductase SoxD